MASAEHSGEDLVAVAILAIEGVRVAAASFDIHELAGVARRNGPQEQLIHQAEDGGIHADTERQRSDGDGSESGISAHGAQRIPYVIARGGHYL